MTLNFVMMVRTLNFVGMSHRGTHILTGSLPEETLREKCPYSDFFWSVFSHIQTEYSVRLWENTHRKNSGYSPFSRSESRLKSSNIARLQLIDS